MSKSEIINYVRVSSVDQNEARQHEALPKDAHRTFTDRTSGSSTNRPALQDMLVHIREGDHIYVHSIDRLARNIEDLHKIVKQIKGQGAAITFVKENLTYNNGGNSAMSDLLFNILGSFAQFERAMIKERQAEGIAAAKAAGKKLGRPSRLSDKDRADIAKQHSQGVSKSALSRKYRVSRATILNICYHAKEKLVTAADIINEIEGQLPEPKLDTKGCFGELYDENDTECQECSFKVKCRG